MTATVTVTTCARCLRRCDRSAAMFALKLPWDRAVADRTLCPTCSADLLGWLLTGPSPAGADPARPIPLTAACTR